MFKNFNMEGHTFQNNDKVFKISHYNNSNTLLLILKI